MPNLGLAEDDADVLIAYIARRSDEPAPGSTPAASSAAIVSSAPASRPAARPADVAALVESYLRIQTALAEDRFEGVLDGALAIANLTAKIGSPAAAVKVGVNPFAQAADLRAAREAFGPLSDAVIAFVRSEGGAMPDGINAAYCPMARKSWLQRGKTIRNPYYGKVMAECGAMKN